MSALNPWGLLALLAIPVLVVLSLWRWRRRTVEVSSLLLWARVAESRRKAPAAQRRRLLDPLLVVRVVVAVCAAGAVAELAFVRPRRPARHLTIVLDRSASMAARRPDGRSRWAAARDALLKLVAALDESDLVDIVALPAPPAMAAIGNLAPDEAARVLRELDPSEAPLLPGELAKAAALAAGGNPSAIIVASDAPPPRLPPGVAALATGGPTANRGIVGFAARRTPGGSWQVLVAVANASRSHSGCRLALLADGRPIAARQLDLPPREVTRVVFEGDLGAASVVVARLAGGDELGVDDAAWLARAARPVRMAWVGAPEPYSRRALAATGRVELVEFPREPQRAVPEGFDLAVYHGATPRALRRGRVVLLAPAASVGPLKVDGAAEARQLVAVAAGHPLLDAVGLDGVRPGRVVRIEPPSGFRTLVRGDGVAAVGLWRSGEAEVLHIGLEPGQGNWPRLVSFPVFWANVVERFAGGREGFRALRPGEPLVLPRGATLLGPGGRRLVAPGGVFRPEEVGLYTRADGGKVAVSLLDERESLTVGEEKALPKTLAGSLRAASRPPAVRRLAPWAIGAMLVLVLLHEVMSGARGPRWARARPGVPLHARWEGVGDGARRGE